MVVTGPSYIPQIGLKRMLSFVQVTESEPFVTQGPQSVVF